VVVDLHTIPAGSPATLALLAQAPAQAVSGQIGRWTSVQCPLLATVGAHGFGERWAALGSTMTTGCGPAEASTSSCRNVVFFPAAGTTEQRAMMSQLALGQVNGADGGSDNRHRRGRATDGCRLELVAERSSQVGAQRSLLT
jgi:hypothetical protein